MSKWIPLAEFNDKYELHRNHVHAIITQHKKKGKTLHGINHIKELGTQSRIYIDEDYFLKRNNFRARMQHHAQDNYYVLTERTKQYALAKVLSTMSKRTQATWSTFMQTQLWQTRDDKYTILSTQLSPMTVEYVKLTNRLIRRR